MNRAHKIKFECEWWHMSVCMARQLDCVITCDGEIVKLCTGSVMPLLLLLLRSKATHQIYIKTFICGLYNKHKFGLKFENQMIVSRRDRVESYKSLHFTILNPIRELYYCRMGARNVHRSILALESQFPFWTIEIYG